MSGGTYMGSTQVSARKTQEEIRTILNAAKASSVTFFNDEAGRTVGVSFGLWWRGRELCYRLPVKVQPVFDKLVKRHLSKNGSLTPARKEKLFEQAERTAWRQVFRWIQAQFALLEMEMAVFSEIFLPYLSDGQGRTFHELLVTPDEATGMSPLERLTASGQLALPESKGARR
jgi:hypothetical protein